MLIRKSIHQLRHLIHNREISVVELLDEYLKQVFENNSDYRVISMMSDSAVRILAQKADRVLESTEQPGPLHGIPILVDDLIDVANMRTSYGSAAYSDHVPEVDSTVVRKLRSAGALILGKARTSEFGVVADESRSAFVTRSPWGSELTSGGGSSGVSAALALNFATASIGMDVGGNVLLPAAFNGVFALKPTHGRIANTPIHSRGMMFPDVTPVTRTVADCALLMNIASGYCEVDPISMTTPARDYVAALNRSIKPLKVGYAVALWNAPVDDDHRSALDDSIQMLESMGCRVEQSRPPIPNPAELWETIFSANLFAQHGKKHAENPEEFTSLVSDYIKRGELLSASEYINAQKKILGIQALLRKFFDSFDILIVTAAGCVPFEYGATPSNLQEGTVPEKWYDYASMFLVGAVSGFPTAQLPVAKKSEGLPVGLLVVGKPGHEDLVLAACAAIESGIAENDEG